MNIQELTAYINQNIRDNGVQAITGDLMQNVLNSIVATLSDGANIVPGSVTRGAIAPGAVDNTPTAGSNNLITSTAVAAAIKAIQTVVLENKELTDAELQNIIKTANGLTDAVNDRIPISEKGMYGGVATLGADGRVPASQLPGFVDDVKEGYLFEGKFYRDAEHTEEIEPQGDMIYIDLVTDKEYRWGGTIFAPISESLALGETASTAYAGSKGKQNAEDIERLKTGKQDTLVSGENLKTLNGESILGAGDIKISGGGGAGLIPITWAELVALRDAGGLTVGAEYRITDFITTTKTRDTLSAGHQYDIIVKALANNYLSEDARATLHEGDTYFTLESISQWKLKYCIDNNTSRFNWVNTTNGKGVVYWMQDENNIQCPYDFKNIKFNHKLDSSSSARYTYTFFNASDTNVDLSLEGKNKNIKVTKTIKSSLDIRAVFTGNNSNIEINGSYCYINASSSIYIGSATRAVINNCTNIYGEAVSTNGDLKITNCKYIRLGLYAGGNILDTNYCYIESVTSLNMSSCKYCIILYAFSSGQGTYTLYNCNNLTIQEGCYNLDISGSSGIIKEKCSNIDIANGKVISIGEQCSDITISQSSCISIGEQCSDISLKQCNNIKIDDQCNNITCGQQTNYSTPVVCKVNNLSIGANCSDIIVLNGFDSSMGGSYNADNVTISNNVKNIKITSTVAGLVLANIAILQGGNETQEIMDLNNYSQFGDAYKFATRNSAGEYKVFVLGDLAPA